MADVVGRWASIVKRINRFSPRSQTTITFGQQQQNCPAAKRHEIFRFSEDKAHLVTKPGDYGSLFNASTNELFTLSWDENPNLGQKMVLPNALQNFEGCRHPSFDVPGYSAHGISTYLDAFGPSNEVVIRPSVIAQRRLGLNTFLRLPCGILGLLLTPSTKHHQIPCHFELL